MGCDFEWEMACSPDMLNWQAFPSRLDDFRRRRLEATAPDGAQPEGGQELAQTLFARGPTRFQSVDLQLLRLPQGVTINLSGSTAKRLGVFTNGTESATFRAVAWKPRK